MITKTNKTFLITLLSLALIVCTALGIVLSTPASAKADTPDYLSWERTEAKEDDLIANRYVLIDKEVVSYNAVTFYNDIADKHFVNIILYFENDGINDDGSECELTLKLKTLQSDLLPEYFHFFEKLYDSEKYAVFFVTPVKAEEETDEVGSLTLTSALTVDADGVYFLTDNGATLPEEGGDDTTTEEETLREFSGVNYNAVYLNEGDTFDNTAYLCVPETISTGVITFTSNGANIHIITPDNIEYTGDKIEAVAYTNRYGVKAYVYDVSSLPEGLIIKGVAGDVSSVYMLTLKDGAEPEVPQPSNPGNGGNTEDPDDGIHAEPNEVEQKDIWDKAREFFTKISEKINENTGVVVGSTGALVLVAVVLYLIFKR